MKNYKKNIKELLKFVPEEDVEKAVQNVCKQYLHSNLTKKQIEQDHKLQFHLNLAVDTDGFCGVAPFVSLFKRKYFEECEFIINTAYSKIEDERRREIIACFHEDDELKEAFLFNFDENRLYRFTRQPDNGFVEEEDSYSRRFKKNIRFFFGTSLEVTKELEKYVIENKDSRENQRLYRNEEEREKRYKEKLEFIHNLLETEKYEQYALDNNFESIPVTEDIRAWFRKKIYDKLSTETSINKDFKTDFLYTNAPVYSDADGTLRSDVTYFNDVVMPEKGGAPTFEYAFWTIMIVGEEGLEAARQKMDDILMKVVTIKEAFLFDPSTRKMTRFSRMEDESIFAEEKYFSMLLNLPMEVLLS